MTHLWLIRRVRLLPDTNTLLYFNNAKHTTFPKVSIDEFIEIFQHSFRMLELNHDLQSDNYIIKSNWDGYYELEVGVTNTNCYITASKKADSISFTGMYQGKPVETMRTSIAKAMIYLHQKKHLLSSRAIKASHPTASGDFWKLIPIPSDAATIKANIAHFRLKGFIIENLKELTLYHSL